MNDLQPLRDEVRWGRAGGLDNRSRREEEERPDSLQDETLDHGRTMSPSVVDLRMHPSLELTPWGRGEVEL